MPAKGETPVRPGREHGSNGAPAGNDPAAIRRAIAPHARETRSRARDGHALRRIDWPGAGETPRGSILFLPGRGDFYEKYLESLDRWHHEGWQVTALDWRGQAGSGRLGRDGLTGHVEDFSHWIEDLAAFWQEWKQQACAPRVLIGHSMGGHLALRAVAEGRVDPEGLILSAPMLGFVGPVPAWLGQKVASLMCRIGDPARPAWKSGEKPGDLPDARQQLLTHDKARYEDELWWRETRKELAMGPASWRWVEQAYRSMRLLFSDRLLERVEIPVLILAAQEDGLVSFAAIERAARRLPHARLVRFGPEARHELLREVDPVRERAMEEIARFLAQLEARAD